VTNTPTPYLPEPVRLPCSRCAALDFLWLVDQWQPLCLVCAQAATESRFLTELLNKRVTKRAVARAEIEEHRRTHPDELPKAG
jgi:hypothetical protein